MGICGSTASSEIHDELNPDLRHHSTGADTAVYLTDPVHGGGPRLGSLHSHQGSKGLNQDTAVLRQGYGAAGGVFCGVFDGHGKNGHVVSEAVRNGLPELLLDRKKALSQAKLIPDDHVSDEAGEWEQAMTTAFSAMDKEIELLENFDCSLSGTTAVVAVKQGDDLFIANLGDSRAILVTATETGSKEFKTTQLTTDLKPGLPDEADRIRRSNGRVFALDEEPHIQRVWMPEENYPGLAMTRSFGDFDLKGYGVISTPELSHHRISPRDKFIVLATDGVWDVLSNDHVAAIAWGASGDAAKEVVTEARKAWKRRFPSAKADDCTALCLFFDGAKQ